MMLLRRHTRNVFLSYEHVVACATMGVLAMPYHKLTANEAEPRFFLLKVQTQQCGEENENDQLRFAVGHHMQLL